MVSHIIYTIGHSSRNISDFIKILIDNGIKCLVDVRSYPGSNAMPQFGKSLLKKSLKKYKIKYIHIPELGGRRRVMSDKHTSLRVKAFAGYADHMQTPEFKHGLRLLKKIGRKCKTAYMCAESLWWKCHRRMISDRLEFDGWKVYHLGLTKTLVRHTIWDVARLDTDDNSIIYDK
jgi:uncharacterized protein (DUF488 family)